LRRIHDEEEEWPATVTNGRIEGSDSRPLMALVATAVSKGVKEVTVSWAGRWRMGQSRRAQMEEEERNGRPLMPWRAAVSSVLALIVT
jgi:hypothetical protein